MADLLEYTQGRSVSFVKADLTPWLAKVVDQFQESEEISITKDFCTDLPAVTHDQGKMRRVIINVMDNALQAVRARVQVEKTAGAAFTPRIIVKIEGDGAKVVIHVSDNGTGMSEETRARAFEPLFTTRARGTGLGLANVKKIVDEHGGHVSLESRLSEGTHLTITLPCDMESAATCEQ
ncbi:MAG: ATP-binding protein [Desulfatitalea sp.]